jgi:SWIB/MDM2 domain
VHELHMTVCTYHYSELLRLLPVHIQILLDEAMQKVFCCNKMTMFSMNKKLSPHLKPASQLVSGTNGTASSSKGSSSSSSKKKTAAKRSSSTAHDSSDDDDR